MYFLLLLLCGALECKENLSHTSLDAYLIQQGLFRLERPSRDKQYLEFIEDLEKLSDVKKILQTGFSTGHLAELFLTYTKCDELVAFDTHPHAHTGTGVQFMKNKYKDRFEFIGGDAKKQIPKYASSHTGKKFDLIFINGYHAFEYMVNDIRSCSGLAHRNTLLWIDDYETILPVKTGVNECVEKGIIVLLDTKFVDSEEGRRSWAIAQYTTPSERIFGNIYKKGLWGRDNRGIAISGPSSTLSEGMPFIEYVQDFLEERPEIQSILDVGCGDWALSRKIEWGERDYLGIDVVRSLVLKNQMQFGTDRIRFAYLDALVDPLPAADLLICKDLLSHLPNDMVFSFLEKMKQFKCCIVVDDVHATHYAASNGDIFLGDFRPVDLTLAPFLLKPKKVSYYRSGMTMKQVLLFERNYTDPQK